MTPSTEWRALAVSFAVVAALAGGAVAAWAIREATDETTTRLELATRCFEVEKGFAVEPAARDPLAASAGDGALRTTIEGNGVTVLLAATPGEALRLESGYRALGADLAGRLERRDRVVWLWQNVSSPTQRQHAYDCQY